MKFIYFLYALFLVGCAAPPEVKQMSVNDGVDVSFIKAKKIQFSKVNVSGGGVTEFIMGSRVEKAGFQTALIQTLDNFSLLNNSSGGYVLNVNLRKCTEPFIGFILEVKCEVDYALVSDANVLKTFAIESSGSANSFDGFNMYHLILRKANERAVQENIKIFTRELNNYYSIEK